MLTVKCIQKFRNNHNKIICYRLQDPQGNTKDVTPQQLKDAMQKNIINIINLTLTSDNRLVDTIPTHQTQQPQPKQPKQKNPINNNVQAVKRVKKLRDDVPSIKNINKHHIQFHVGSSKWTNDDWSTIAFLIDRRELSQKFIDKELRFNGIYFLVDYDNCYTGQALKRKSGESFLARLREHDDALDEAYHDNWLWAIAITNKDDIWGSTEADALESYFIDNVPEEYNNNGRGQNSGGADFSLYEDKINQIKSLVTAMGFTFFSMETVTENIQVTYVTDENNVVEDLQNGMSSIPEIVTPHKVVKAMVDMLPADVWNSHTTFLDPACKGGEYLREIYERLMDCELLQSEFPNTIERSNHILKNQIYGIALSQVSIERTTKKLLGEDRNIRVIPDYINKLKGINLGSRPDGSQNNIIDIINKEFGADMKFDVIIGNPPYNDTDDTGSSKPINTLFVNAGISMNAKYIAFIMPDRWFVSPDKFNTNCRESLVGKIKYLRDFDDNRVVFGGVNIAGGVSYFLYDKDYDGEMVYEDSTGIINVKHNEKFMCKSCRSNLLYNHVKDTTQKYMDEPWISTSFFGLTRNAQGSVIETEDCNITLKSSGADTYLSIDDIPRNSKCVPLYKVAIPYSAMKPKPFILKPNEICTLTYLIVRLFNNITEAENCKKYLETNFFNILFSGLKTKLGTTKENFMCIPLQDFTPSSDIDWSQPINLIDQQLYKKYGLTDLEIDYIDGKIDTIPNTGKQTQPKYTIQDALANYVYKQINS